MSANGPEAQAAPGDVDPTFLPSGFRADEVQAVAITPADRILVGGYLSGTNLVGDPIEGTAYLGADGAYDPSFGVAGSLAMVSAMAVDTLGRVVCAGVQTNSLNAVVRRLDPLGVLDPAIDLVFGGNLSPWVYDVELQSDGRLLVAGSFTRVGSVSRTNLVRIHTDGTVDLSFKTNFNATGPILVVALQADDKVLIGGTFTNVNGTIRRGIARLNVDGSLDTTFNPGTGVQGLVKAIGIQADGRILIGGYFFSVNGVLRSGLARLLPNGSLDTTFHPGDGAELIGVDNPGTGPSVDALVQQGDGRWIVGGNFNHFGGLARSHLVRLNWDGAVDENFDVGTGPNAPVRSLALDSNGFLAAGGEFTTVNGLARMRVARIESDGRRPVLPVIVEAPSDLVVTLGQTATFSVKATGTPELRYVWRKGGLDLPNQTNATLVLSNCQFSDAGRYSVMVYNTAGEVVSSTATLSVNPAPVAPTLVAQPTGGFLKVGDAITLSAAATGSKPLAWQWRLGTADVVGATNSSMTLAAITTTQAGSYSARVSNAAGSAVTVPTPVAVYIPPSDITEWAGSNATLRVQAFGPGPFGYQWLHEGTNLPGATKSSLLITNLSLNHSGLYTVMLSNATSRATSPPALLTVTMAPLILAHPVTTVAATGEVVTLSVSAQGSSPLTYQWRLQGTNLPGATASSLSLGPVTAADAGYYSVIIANGFGSTTSRVATVTISNGTVSTLILDDASTFSGGTVSVPVHLIGVGTENTLAFNLQFDPDLLTLLAASNGVAIAEDTSVVLNTEEIDQGRAGVLIAQPGGFEFPAGTNHLLTLHFGVAQGIAAATVTAVTFGSTPVTTAMLSSAVRPLAANYEGARITIEAGLEGDLSPAPGGDGLLTAADWAAVARLVGGLVDLESGSQTLRADCAPLETLGDGVLDAADWTQAGRYVAGIDSPKLAGGPSTLTGSKAGLAAVDEEDAGDVVEELERAVAHEGRRIGRMSTGGGLRRIEVSGAQAPVGEAVTLEVRLQAVGDENTAGFTLIYDPSKLRYLGGLPGPGLPGGAVLLLNTNKTPQGRLGVLIGQYAGEAFSSGLHTVLKAQFEVTGQESAVVGFGDTPVRREVVSSEARVLATTYASATVRVELPPQAPVPLKPARQRNGTLLLRWNAAQPGHYVLETSADLRTWTPLTEWTVTSASTLEFNESEVAVQPQKFFRVR
ncbi:MAG: immunoglobulin domain-containing protein [Verrucomicrobiales bacterium]|nr:immunoglobulin domain-containing protein [Verrucomicrobiales bacterium]